MSPGTTIALPRPWVRVEIAATSNASPPDQQGGQSCARGTTWVRLVGDDFDSGWHATSRSLHRVREWWLAVETPDDVPDAWEGSVETPWPPPRYDDAFRAGVAWLDGAP